MYKAAITCWNLNALLCYFISKNSWLVLWCTCRWTRLSLFSPRFNFVCFN